MSHSQESDKDDGQREEEREEDLTLPQVRQKLQRPIIWSINLRFFLSFILMSSTFSCVFLGKQQRSKPKDENIEQNVSRW